MLRALLESEPFSGSEFHIGMDAENHDQNVRGCHWAPVRFLLSSGLFKSKKLVASSAAAVLCPSGKSAPRRE